MLLESVRKKLKQGAEVHFVHGADAGQHKSTSVVKEDTFLCLSQSSVSAASKVSYVWSQS